MAAASPRSPENSKVLAIASHVVSGYVGNSVTTFVLQLLGLETASLNTVQFSNHSGYHQKTGEATSAELVQQLWEGLKMNGLHEGFDMALTGYVPGPAQLEAVGRILKETKAAGGGCFWLLDPVMGDQGRLYVSEGVVPVYRSLLPHADLIVPNQFETELLSEIEVNNIASLSRAIDELHDKYHIPHIVVTSVSFSAKLPKMVCAGSSKTSEHKSRKFTVDVPIIDGFFSGTGDLFAALTLARFREASADAGLLDTTSWAPPDDVKPAELPLAKAVSRVLASMHKVLLKTKMTRDGILEKYEGFEREHDPKKKHIATTRASELRLVQSQAELLDPGLEGSYIPKAIE